MKRLVFIVEGDTELLLLDKVVIPYLITKGISNISKQTIVTNRKQHKKGGVGSYGKYKNEVMRTLSQGNVLVTTLVDFYALPTDFPDFSTDKADVVQMEQAILTDFGNTSDFIPYIQLHEVEALMFSSTEGFEFVEDDENKIDLLRAIMQEYPNPEDINNSPETAPSKRLINIIDYDKTGDGEFILEMVGIGAMLDKCPRFKDWIHQIIHRMS